MSNEDKEKPMQTMAEATIGGQHFAQCGKCKELISRSWVYCPWCGQKILWK